MAWQKKVKMKMNKNCLQKMRNYFWYFLVKNADNFYQRLLKAKTIKVYE